MKKYIKYMKYIIKNFESCSITHSDIDDKVYLYPFVSPLSLSQLIRLENSLDVDTFYKIFKGDNPDEWGVIDINIKFQFKLFSKDVYIFTWVENNNKNQPIEIFREYEDYIKDKMDKLNVTFL